jgi:hypothetical protein
VCSCTIVLHLIRCCAMVRPGGSLIRGLMMLLLIPPPPPTPLRPMRARLLDYLSPSHCAILLHTLLLLVSAAQQGVGLCHAAPDRVLRVVEDRGEKQGNVLHSHPPPSCPAPRACLKYTTCLLCNSSSCCCCWALLSKVAARDGSLCSAARYRALGLLN